MSGSDLVVAIDFDGTLVLHEYPQIGEPVPGAFEWCRRFQDDYGAKLILWTMRSVNPDGPFPSDFLTPAVEFCRARGLEFWGVNQNPGQTWSKSPKAYAHIYIDDAAAGTPLIYSMHDRNSMRHHRPYVNWSLVGPHVAMCLRELRYFQQIDLTPLQDAQNAWAVSLPQQELPERSLVQMVDDIIPF